MSRKVGPTIVLVPLLVLVTTSSSHAQQFWTVQKGSTKIELKKQSNNKDGLNVTSRDSSPGAGGALEIVLGISPDSTLTVAIDGSAGPSFLGGAIVHSGGLTVKTAGDSFHIARVAMGPTLGPSFESQWSLHAGDGVGTLIMERYKVGFDPATDMLTFYSPEVLLSEAMAEVLGQPELAHTSIGELTLSAQLIWIGGDPADALASVGPALPRAVEGPDMKFCQLYQLAQYGRLGDIVGLAVATTSWNVGTRDLMWFPTPEVQHPFIVMNLYRLKGDRFEQIGQSSIKHGFYALGSTQCGTPCTFEPGHSAGRWLGVGCTDTYSSGLNASQSGLSPRSELNPWTGSWTYGGSHLSQGNHSHNAIQHRLQVHDADLNPAQNPGATYYCEGYYAILDDVDVMNSAAWKPVTVSGSPGGTWTFGMSPAGTMPTSGFAIDAWAGATKTTIAQDVPVIEFVSPDGRCVLAAKATDRGGGVWRYEYALLNIDMHRKVNSFSIPVRPWHAVSNIGFHAVESHDEPFSNDPWPISDLDDMIVWSTANNPVRWGTLYNFWFDASAPPVSDATVKLGLFVPGTPASITGTTIGPDTALNGDAIRGGLLWDKWWAVNGSPAPTGNHPLYPPAGQQSGSSTYRCKECHGWDYKGAAGAYGSGSHYTGIPGVYGTAMETAEMFQLIKTDFSANGHAFRDYGLSDQDIVDLLQFMQDQVIDTDRYIDSAAQFIGDPVQGQINYETGGWTSCTACHGSDGTDINFGSAEQPQWVGSVAVKNPWELLHKTRFGQPGVPMPSWLEWGGDDQGAADLGRYCQLNFPVDCITTEHCVSGGPCNMCQTGRCVPSIADGDLLTDGNTDGADIQLFVEAVMAGSTDPDDLNHGDFSGNGVIDEMDMPCMVNTLLGL